MMKKKYCLIMIIALLCICFAGSCSGKNKIKGENVYLNPDGWDFAQKFGSFDVEDKESVVLYWDTGKKQIKFETVSDEIAGYILKINDNKTDINWSMGLSKILVSDEFIVVVTSGTDIRSNPIYIFYYKGKTLFRTYYLNNKGMVVSGSVSIEGDNKNKIVMSGTRITHGPSLVMSNYADDDYFSAYSDYLYEDKIYDYGERNVSDLNEVSFYKDGYAVNILNKDEIVEADFEIEYLGNGKFGNIKMTGNQINLRDYFKSINYVEQIYYG